MYNLPGYKPESIVEKTGKVLTSAMKKLIKPEDDDEEAAYDREDDLVRPDHGFEARWDRKGLLFAKLMFVELS